MEAIESDPTKKASISGKEKIIELQETQNPSRSNEKRELETKQLNDEFFSLVTSPISDTEKILAATILLENAVNAILEMLDPKFKNPRRNPRAAIDRLIQLGVLTNFETTALLEMRNLRNKIVHQGLRPTSEQTTRFLEISQRLLKQLGW